MKDLEERRLTVIASMISLRDVHGFSTTFISAMELRETRGIRH
jgi:hypothetical protein